MNNINSIQEADRELSEIERELEELRKQRERIEAAARAAASVKSTEEQTEEDNTLDLSAQIHTALEESAFIPEVDTDYVRWGEFRFVSQVVKSLLFHPLFICGPSGNGKTVLVEQACARAKRKYVRVQISPETDEDDLLGGFRLVNGNTVFEHGPVIKAMKEGAVLLIDEIDRSSHKLMCLQGVLEGKPVLLKKTKEIIHPAKGFTVIATGNTDGRGSEDGRYASAIHIDEAFLERFVNFINQPWPTRAIEKRIIVNRMKSHGCHDEDFANKLVDWTRVIREAHSAEAVDDVISTRRLCHIVSTYAITGDRLSSIWPCVSRFGKVTSEIFLDLYNKVDGGEVKPEGDEESNNEEENGVHTDSTVNLGYLYANDS